MPPPRWVWGKEDLAWRSSHRNRLRVFAKFRRTGCASARPPEGLVRTRKLLNPAAWMACRVAHRVPLRRRCRSPRRASMTPSRRTGRRFPTLTFVFVALLAGGSVLWSYWTTLAEAAERWAVDP